jgi:thioredoxin reductase (NADPH)
MQKVVIAGSGPAGLTAAIYAARADLNPLVFEGPSPGGQLIVSHEVENYPGFIESISGAELMDRFKKQAQRLGAEFKTKSINKVETRGENYLVHADGESVETQALIIATGAEARRLPIPTEDKFYGCGVSGCATCDGAFFRGKEVLVVGGGNTAMEDAVFLTKFANKVTIVHRRDYLRAAPAEVNKAKAISRIEWLIPYTVEEIKGDQVVSGAVLKNVQSGETREIECQGIFVAIGHNPKTAVFKELVQMDESGFIKVNPNTTQTSAPGIFACGDVQDPIYKQAVLAAGSGCMAAMDVEKYLGLKE